MNYSSFGFTSSLLIVVLGLGSAASRAQGPAVNQVDQSDWNRKASSLADQAVGLADDQAPELFDGESSDLGPQTILNVQPRQYLEAVVDSQIFHTDNFFLTNGGEVGATTLVNTLQLALAPPPYALGSGEFEPRLGFRQQWYNFGVVGNENGGGFKLDMFDFYGQTAFVDGRYHFGDGWTGELGIDAARLVDTNGERYKELVPRWGIRKRLELDDSKQVFVGYEGLYHESTARASIPPAFRLTDRFDHTIFGILTATVTDRLVAQAHYRFRYTDFQKSGRTDYLHSVGVGLHYFFNSDMSVRTFVGYDHRATDGSPVPDYDKLNLGGGINATISF